MATAALMQQARIAIREGRLVDARRLLRQVIHEEPSNHAAWLLLARATPDVELSAEYIERAQQIQPDSPLVQSAVADLVSGKNEAADSNRSIFSWHLAPVLAAIALLIGLVTISFGGGSSELATALQNESVERVAAAAEEPLPEKPEQAKRAEPAAIEPTPSNLKATPARESTIDLKPTPTLSPALSGESSGVEESVEDTNKEQETDSDPQEASDTDQEALPAAILMGIETEASSGESEEVAEASDETAADEASSTEAGGESEEESAGEAAVEEDTTASDPAESAAGERWIDVNLTTQTLVAYEGETPVLYSTISSGLWQFPTVTGQFQTWMKYDTQNMTGYHLGYNYEIPDVPYVMYFFEDYAIHGAYWHNSFGTPMSHGCVNMNVTDAEWLYGWAPLGTLVDVHD